MTARLEPIDEPVRNVRGRHRRRHGRARVAGDRGRRGARRQRTRAVDDPLRRRPTWDRDAAAARDAVPAHVPRRRRLPAPADPAQPRVPPEAGAQRPRPRSRLLRELRPRVVVSVGGYASMPGGARRRRLRIPVVVVSYDRFPGRASRFAARRAAACAVAFPDSPLPRATVTGAPVRRAVLDVDRRRDAATARAALGLPPDRFVVAVMGGSQGSGILNDAVAAMLDACAADRGLAIRHVVGERFAGRRRRHRATDAAACSTSRSATSRRCRSCTRPPTCSSGAAGRARCTRSRSPASRRSSCRGGAAEDHQTANVRGSPRRAPRCCSRSGGSTSWRRSSTGSARTRRPARYWATSARAMGEVHRSGALADLVEAVALA